MSRIVLVTSDSGEREKMRTHWVYHNYIPPILDIGAIPLLLPNLGPDTDFGVLLDRVDGVLVTGARSNVHPSKYGEPATAEYEPHDRNRDETTLPLIRAAVDLGIPLLAICRGIQELNVAFGGSLLPALPASEGYLNHSLTEWDHPDELFGLSHEVIFEKDSGLTKFTGKKTIRVNSAHRQGIDRLSEKLTVEARAADGTIEAVRVTDAPGFAYGVQWHPEYWAAHDGPAAAIFTAFAEAMDVYSQGDTISVNGVI